MARMPAMPAMPAMPKFFEGFKCVASHQQTVQSEKARWTSIRLSLETRERLRRLGEKGQTYDEIVRFVLRKAGLDEQKAEPTATEKEGKSDELLSR